MIAPPSLDDYAPAFPGRVPDQIIRRDGALQADGSGHRKLPKIASDFRCNQSREAVAYHLIA